MRDERRRPLYGHDPEHLRIVVIGILLVLGTLGARWSQLQWLAAALGVGIGFGLQEIVANFISGIIILFERPIRVGDTVTVGDTDGVVTRIQIRATTLVQVSTSPHEDCRSIAWGVTAIRCSTDARLHYSTGNS